MLHLAAVGGLKFPVSIKHGDSPDFIVDEAGDVYGIEATEACTQEDGQEMARLEGLGRPIFIGELGGRGKDGYAGDEPLFEVRSDIQNAINRKAAHEYTLERPTDLVIYPNSNPMLVLAEPEDREAIVHERFDLKGLRRVFILWDSDSITQLIR